MQEGLLRKKKKNQHFPIIRENTTNVQGVEKREPRALLGRNVNWGSHCGKQHGAVSKN